MSNPIHALLDAAGFPWRETRAALAGRYGKRVHPAYRWEVIEVPTAPPLCEGLIWPLSAQVFEQISPAFPATRFSSVAWFFDDARENLRRTERAFDQALGPSQRSENGNSLKREWRSGAASIELIVWPADMQRFPINNPAHGREPRVKSGCHVAIETGWRPDVTAEELVWVRAFSAVGRVGGPSTVYSPDIAANESQLEFVRAPIPGAASLFSQVGCSADGQALIFCTDQLYLVRTGDIVRFQVSRLRPGKGSGGASLRVECRGHSGVAKGLTIGRSDDPDGLTDLATRLSAACRRPLKLEPYDDDT
jgi:hypothetical protein